MKIDLTSWTAAEQSVMAVLCEATGSELKRNAFIGTLPPSEDVWRLTTGTIEDPQTLWDSIGHPKTIHMGGQILGQFSTREKAQRLFLAMIDALPINCETTPNVVSTNVHLFRNHPQGLLVVEERLVELANWQRPVMRWVVEIGCELIFTTIPAQE